MSETTVQNPLLNQFETPHESAPFHLIEDSHFKPAIEEAMQLAREEFEQIKNNPEEPDFTNTIVALDRMGSKLDRITSIFFNLNSAETNDTIQQIAQEVSPLLTEFFNDISLDATIFERVKKVYSDIDSQELDVESRTLLEKTYKSFVRNGANLSEDKKATLREIDVKLSRLSLTFGEHVLKETNKYKLFIDNEEDLSGLPETIREAAAETAKENDREDAWCFTLEYPSFVPFLTFADNRELRKELYMAFHSKCCKGDELDNHEIVKEIATLRYDRAQLLGYDSHAHFTLEERMAESSEKVEQFQDEMLQYALPAAESDFKELSDFARESGGPEKLERYDVAYYSEKLKKKKYEIDDELLKPYFQLENVTDGVFNVANRLYGLTFKKNTDIPVYHKDVIAYEVFNANDDFVAVFYADFFPRSGKRGGAWMTIYKDQYKDGDHDNRPHVSIVCNFNKPTKTKPSLLTFNEVLTLFHEFGHALHGMLANGVHKGLTGTSVYWDFVELPSQILENWCYEKECLDLFAKHYETGDPIPAEYVERIKKSANFMSGYQTLRQLGFGLTDMGWHKDDPKNIENIEKFESEVIPEYKILPKVEGTAMSCQFSHVFQGGYAAGYYSYKWAEVLDADAFEEFKKEGLFSKEIAGRFHKEILSKGGSEHPMILYKRFKGQEPTVDALLKRSGLKK